MPRITPFYSINEPRKSVRVFHSNDMCQPGREISPWDRLPGTNGYRECEVCAKRNRNWDSLPAGAARDLFG